MRSDWMLLLIALWQEVSMCQSRVTERLNVLFFLGHRSLPVGMLHVCYIASAR